jgi:speckle-type POZ protein
LGAARHTPVQQANRRPAGRSALPLGGHGGDKAQSPRSLKSTPASPPPEAKESTPPSGVAALGQSGRNHLRIRGLLSGTSPSAPRRRRRSTAFSFSSMAMADNSFAAAETKANICLAKSSSRCVVGSVTTTHDFEVTNFSLLDGMGVGKFVTSSTFSVGGRDWNIRLYPDGDKTEHKDHVSVFLRFLKGPVGVRVKFSLSLLGKKDNQAEVMEDTHTFDCLTDWGWSKFMEKSKLKPLLQHNNDSFTVRCVLTVIKDPRTEDTNTIAVPQSNLAQQFECLLKDGKGTDVTFSVDGQLFHAHRCVLAARSSVFEAELLGPMKKKPRQHIDILDMEPSIFEVLLHFIYTDSLPVDSEASENERMQHLLVAADRYGLERLRVMCEAKLCQGIDVQTVATTLALAEQHHCVQLKNACLRFVVSPDVLPAVMKTDGYKHLAVSCQFVVQEILDKIVAVANE